MERGKNPVVHLILETGLRPKQQPQHKGNIVACPQIQQKQRKRKTTTPRDWDSSTMPPGRKMTL
jgi:hypothetical protein